MLSLAQEPLQDHQSTSMRPRTSRWDTMSCFVCILCSKRWGLQECRYVMQSSAVHVMMCMLWCPCYDVHDMTWQDRTKGPGYSFGRHTCHSISPPTSQFHLTSYSYINQADAAVYNTLINACAGVGDLEKALETVQAMQVTHKPWLYQNFFIFFVI